MHLESPAFSHGERIPVRYTCEGEDISPPLRWSAAPPGTQSFVLLMDDPDAPMGTWTHWAAYDIPPDVHGLPEGFPTDPKVDGIKQGMTDFKRTGYGGPCPPRGHGIHHYHFRILALSVPTLGLPPGADFHEVEAAALPHVLAKGELMGTYSR